MSEESDSAGNGRVLGEAREAAQVLLREMSRRLGVGSQVPIGGARPQEAVAPGSAQLCKRVEPRSLSA